MQRVVTEERAQVWFQVRKLETGSWHESLSEKYYIVTCLGPGVSVDEYNDEHRGFFYELRSPTPAETNAREKAIADWSTLEPEERTRTMLESLTARFPGLDWGERPASNYLSFF